jgi:hypothetical protein
MVPPALDKAGPRYVVIDLRASSSEQEEECQHDYLEQERSGIISQTFHDDYTMGLGESPHKAISERCFMQNREAWICARGSSIPYFFSSSSRGKQEKDLVGYSTLESRVRRQRPESDESQPVACGTIA